MRRRVFLLAAVATGAAVNSAQKHADNVVLFTATPIRLVGATGAPAHPLAIF